MTIHFPTLISIPFFTYLIALKEEPNPSKIFRANMADVSEAIESSLERIADRLFSETLIGQDILQSTTINLRLTYL